MFINVTDKAVLIILILLASTFNNHYSSHNNNTLINCSRPNIHTSYIGRFGLVVTSLGRSTKLLYVFKPLNDASNDACQELMNTYPGTITSHSNFCGVFAKATIKPGQRTWHGTTSDLDFGLVRSSHSIQLKFQKRPTSQALSMGRKRVLVK